MVRRFEEENAVLDEPESPRPEGARYLGVDGFRQALAELDAALGPGGERHVKFKIYRIEPDQGTFITSVRYEASRMVLAGAGNTRQSGTAAGRTRWTNRRSPSKGSRC